MLVRNAADIIEAFVRHNLRVFDGLSILDHGGPTVRAKSSPR
jgi:hypothetical protein